ncbi:MAG TPA: hypothetical protein PLV52_03575, partial [Candidatus Omnitrophota bacterium]|nr:hypothetical protein [Candidatus Omnitrophota bacterium]
MKDNSNNEKAAAFDRMIRSLAAAVKNSALYPPGHPSLSESIKSFRSDLLFWLGSSEKLELGIAPNNLLANGEYIKKEGSDLYAEVASYLHQRGLIAVNFRRAVTEEELGAFLNLVKADPKICAESGGISKNMPKSDNITLREIDYRGLLKSYRSGSSGAREPDDKDFWQSLVALSTGPVGDLPLSKAEFIEGFIRNPERSAAVLNKVYREALAKVDHKATLKKMRAALTRVAKYFEAKGDAMPEASHKDIIDIILKLDPGLIVRLFEDDKEGQGEANFSEDLARAMPDDAVADFIASLVGKEGVLNEQFIKLFEKLTSENGRSSNLNTMIGDKLLGMASADKDLIARLQSSFKDMLKTNPNSGFINEIYKMTIDTFADSGVSQIPRSDEYLRISRETAEALKDDSIRRQEVRLILNLIWLERSPEQFRKLCELLAGKLSALFDTLSVQVLKDVYELFTSFLDEKVKSDSNFAEPISMVTGKIMDDTAISKVVELIKGSGPAEINNISRILRMTKPKSISLIADSYMLEMDTFARGKISKVMKSIGGDVLDELLARLKSPGALNPEIRAGLLDIVNAVNPEEARRISTEMLKSKDPNLIAQALDIFTVKTKADAQLLLGILSDQDTSE